LHPKYLDFWGNIDGKELKILRGVLKENFIESEKRIVLKNDKGIKKILEKAFICHKVEDSKIYFDENTNYVFRIIFDLDNKKFDEINENDDVFMILNKISNIQIRNKAPYFMGTRMGRPEKSERKSMKGVHTLFPLSDKVGSTRLVEKGIEFGKVKIDVCRKKCPRCGNKTIFNICSKCGTHTEFQKICNNCKKLFPKFEEQCSQCGKLLDFSSEASFNIKAHISSVLKSLKMPLPKKFKGIFGLTNQFKVPEPIEKGILRAKNGLLVYNSCIYEEPGLSF